MKKITIIMFLIVSASFNICTAQKGIDKKQFNERIDSVLKQKLIQKINIDNATADKFVSVFRANMTKIRSKLKEKKELMKSIESDPESFDIESKLDKMIDIDSQILNAKNDYYKELKTFLTPQQIAKSMILRNNFDKELKKQMKKRGKGKKFNDKGDKGDDN